MLFSSILFLTVPALSASPAQNPGDLQDAPAAVPQMVLENAAGELSHRPIEELSGADFIENKTVFLRFEGVGASRTPEAGERQMRVELLGGGHVRARLLGGEEEFLDMRLSGGSRLRLSLEEFSSFQLPGRFPAAWAQPVIPAEAGDRLYRRSGSGLDRIDGTLEGFDPERGVSMETSLGSKTFPWDEVAALFLEVFEEDAPTSEHTSVILDLMDGSRIPLGFMGLSSSGLDLQTAAGRGLRIPLSAVSEVFLPGRGVSFLSQMEPLLVEDASPFGDDLGMSWPIQKDRTVTGGPLRCGGRLWTRGLGVHGPCRVSYDLKGDWKHLRGSVGIDDEVIPLPAKGSVIFRVLGDGEVLWESPVMHGGALSIELPGILLDGVQTLVLEVDTADNLHLGDRADWLGLILS